MKKDDEVSKNLADYLGISTPEDTEVAEESTDVTPYPSSQNVPATLDSSAPDLPVPKTLDTAEDVSVEQMRQLKNILGTSDENIQNAQQVTNQLLGFVMQTIINLQNIAQESEEPRAYEVLAQWIKMASDLTGQQVDFSKKHVDIVKVTTGQLTPKKASPTTVHNNLFITTNDLDKLLDGDISIDDLQQKYEDGDGIIDAEVIE